MSPRNTSIMGTPITRRPLLALLGASALAPALLPEAAMAQGNNDPRMADRFAGKDTARVTVLEYFSLTCPHCARFSKDVFPKIKEKLADTGQVKLVFRDYPLDQLALAAAQVARALPTERYVPFVEALFATQDRWAYTRGGSPFDELAKMAALAGMSRASFNAAIADEALRSGVLAAQKDGERRYNINSTPSFVIGGKTYSGEQSFEEFSRLVGNASA